MTWLAAPTRFIFFTGKGGVGKTSIACATAVALADAGRRTLLVSTDPASNLNEVLGQAFESAPRPAVRVPGLEVMNLDPEAAARGYRERVVGPYRGVLPAAAVASIEEQLSGACTVEIATFDELVKLLAAPDAERRFDHIVFDTAPTGHTLRLLELPAAWTTFFDVSETGASCLGPLSGLAAQRDSYRQTTEALADGTRTTIVVVSRPETLAIKEAARAVSELAAQGIRRAVWVVNGRFERSAPGDGVAAAWAQRERAALAVIPSALAGLPRLDVPLLPSEVVGLGSVRGLGAVLRNGHVQGMSFDAVGPDRAAPPVRRDALQMLVNELETPGRGVILVMGKGGVGKTTVAAAIAAALAQRGHRVRLTTTDPAAHLVDVVTSRFPTMTVDRIDPIRETELYREEVLAGAGAQLDDAGRKVLVEDLSSPCTTEIAVFRAFARTVGAGEGGFVVMDTAPTGHTLLLLDAARAFHREVERTRKQTPDDVASLLPRLRDASATRVLIVTTPEATPVHEAAALQTDLRRAGLEPYAWIVNQALSPLVTADPLLRRRQASEQKYIHEVEHEHASRIAIVPWSVEPADALPRST